MLSADTFARLFDAVREANDDEQVRVVVVTAEGKDFSIGGDLNWEREFSPAGSVKMMREHSHLSLELRNAPKPYIASVRGYCIGGANELALHCDMTIASTTAVFMNPEVRWGLVPFWYTPQLLPLAIGERRAREFLLTGRRYSAEAALSMGLVNAVVPDEQLESATLALAEELIANDALALRLTKIALNGVGDMLRGAANHEAAIVPLVVGTESYQAAVQRFFERRGRNRGAQA
jgi:enoyl-CoA hydratase/carnithine racemase